MRHDWREVKDGVLRQYPVYQCTSCLTKLSMREVRLFLIHVEGWTTEQTIVHMTPEVGARRLGIDDDCDICLVSNITES